MADRAAEKLALPSGDDRLLQKIVSRKLDSSKSPPVVNLLVSCGCTVTKPLSRVPRGSNMYCQGCRESSRKSK